MAIPSYMGGSEMGGAVDPDARQPFDVLAYLRGKGLPPTAENASRTRQAMASNERGDSGGGGGASSAPPTQSMPTSSSNGKGAPSVGRNAPSGGGAAHAIEQPQGELYGGDTFDDSSTGSPPSASGASGASPPPTVVNSTASDPHTDRFGQQGNPELAAMILGGLGLGGAGLYAGSRMMGGGGGGGAPMRAAGPAPPPVPLSAMNFTPPEVSPTGLTPGPRAPILPPRVPGQMPQMQVPDSSLQAGPRSDIASRAMMGEPPVAPVDPLQSAMNKAVPPEPPPVPPQAAPNPNAGKPPAPETTPGRQGPLAKGPTESNATLRSAAPAQDPARLAELAKQIWPNASTDELIALVRSVFKAGGKMGKAVR